MGIIEEIYKSIMNQKSFDTKDAHEALLVLLSSAKEYDCIMPDEIIVNQDCVEYPLGASLFVYVDEGDDDIHKAVLASNNGAGVMYTGIYKVHNTWVLDPCVMYAHNEGDAFYTRMDNKPVGEDDTQRISALAIVSNTLMLQQIIHDTEKRDDQCIRM